LSCELDGPNPTIELLSGGIGHAVLVAHPDVFSARGEHHDWRQMIAEWTPTPCIKETFYPPATDLLRNMKELFL
jgi:hypothetical protein